jgi:hypothetical protein
MAMGVLLWTCALPMFLGGAYMLTVQPIITLQRDNDVRRQLIGNTVSSRPSGTGPVILEGRIDPELVVPPDAGDLALVERETLRTDSSWNWDLFAHPDFTLLLAEGPVRVTNGCYRQESEVFGRFLNFKETLGLDGRCYRLGGITRLIYEDHGRRFRGFRPGDHVHAIGTIRDGQLTARSVFGGSPEDYAASLRQPLWSVLLSVAIGLAFLGTVAAVGFDLWRTRRRCLTRRRSD